MLVPGEGAKSTSGKPRSQEISLICLSHFMQRMLRVGGDSARPRTAPALLTVANNLRNFFRSATVEYVLSEKVFRILW